MKHEHFKLYKPFGVLSQLQSNDKKEVRKKRFLTELYDFNKGVMPVGRLDEKSEGLLLMTSDGHKCNEINLSGVEKQYLAQLDGIIGKEAINRLCKGVEIGIEGEKYLTIPCTAHILKADPELPAPNPKLRLARHRPCSWISITLREGKYRQVRKMTAAVGFPTLRLVRIRIGSIHLGEMAPGEVQEVLKL